MPAVELPDDPERPARPEDVDDLCGSLPGTWFGTSWGDRPTWLVRRRVTGDERAPDDKGRGFVLYRKPHRTALDPETGEAYDDLLVVATPDAAAKVALVEGEGPFFTVDHFRSSNAVLVQLSRLGEISLAELREVVTDAWRATAPAALVREHTE